MARSSGSRPSAAPRSRLFGSRPAAPAQTTAPAARPSAPAPAAAPAAAAPAAHQAPSAPAAPAAPAAPMMAPAPSSGGGIMSSIVGGIAQGMMFGTGSAIANRAVDAVMGPRTVVHEHQNAPAPAAAEAAPVAAAAPAMAAAAPTMASQNDLACRLERDEFQRCMKNNNADLARCQQILDVLTGCQNQFKSMQ